MFIEEDFEDWVCDQISAETRFKSVGSLDGIELNDPERIGQQVGMLPACRVMLGDETYADQSNSAQVQSVDCRLLVLVFAGDASRDRGRKAEARELCRSVKASLRGLRYKSGMGKIGTLRLRSVNPLLAYRSVVVYQMEFSLSMFDHNSKDNNTQS